MCTFNMPCTEDACTRRVAHELIVLWYIRSIDIRMSIRTSPSVSISISIRVYCNSTTASISISLDAGFNFS